MAEKLDPCPFCGGVDRHECGCLFSYIVGFDHQKMAIKARGITVEEFIFLWNTRAERTCSYVEHCDGVYHYYQCSECQCEMAGWDFELYSPNYCMDCGAKIDEVVSDAD